jgi:hypothetical protein
MKEAMQNRTMSQSDCIERLESIGSHLRSAAKDTRRTALAALLSDLPEIKQNQTEHLEAVFGLAQGFLGILANLLRRTLHSGA